MKYSLGAENSGRGSLNACQSDLAGLPKLGYEPAATASPQDGPSTSESTQLAFSSFPAAGRNASASETLQQAMCHALSQALGRSPREVGDAFCVAKGSGGATPNTSCVWESPGRCAASLEAGEAMTQEEPSNPISQAETLLLKAQDAECSCEGKAKGLKEAAENGCLRCCAEHIGEAGAITNGMTPLMKAAEKGHPELVRLLVHKEAKMQTYSGLTALMFAAWHGNAECVRLLLPHEAGMRQLDGRTAMYHAAVYFQSECVALLMADGKETAEVPGQMKAAFAGDLRTMLGMQNKWKETVCDNLTILHFAVAGGSQRCLEILAQDIDTQRFAARKDLDFGLMREGADGVFKRLVPIILRKDDESVSNCFTGLLFNDRTASAKALSHLAAIFPNERLSDRIEGCESGQTLLELARLARNIGLIFGRQTLPELALKQRGEIQELIAGNPICAKQLEMARKQIARNAFVDWRGNDRFEQVHHNSQFSVREIRSEAAFNRFILLASRDISWKSISSQRSPRDQRPSTIRSKQERNRLLIRNTIRFVKGELRKMLQE